MLWISPRANYSDSEFNMLSDLTHMRQKQKRGRERGKKERMRSLQSWQNARQQLELKTKAVAAFCFLRISMQIFPVQQTDDNHKCCPCALPPLWPPSKWTDICQHNRDIHIQREGNAEREREWKGKSDRHSNFLCVSKKDARVCFSCILHEKLGRARATHTHCHTHTYRHTRMCNRHDKARLALLSVNQWDITTILNSLAPVHFPAA